MRVGGTSSLSTTYYFFLKTCERKIKQNDKLLLFIGFER